MSWPRKTCVADALSLCGSWASCRAGHGQCAATLHDWGIRDNPLCACGSKQTVTHRQRMPADQVSGWTPGTPLCRRRFLFLASQAQHRLEEDRIIRKSMWIPLVRLTSWSTNLNLICASWFYFPPIIFSRSYCYTVWSAIGSSLLSVRLSVCNAVHSDSQGWCTLLKVVPACS